MDKYLVLIYYTFATSGVSVFGSGYFYPKPTNNPFEINLPSSQPKPGYVGDSNIFSIPERIAPTIRKHFYYYTAPDEQEETRIEQLSPNPHEKIDYRIIFIKAPAYISESEEKTVIYVLSKKSTEENTDTFVTTDLKKITKPEVFFINYNNEEEADNFRKKIKDHYASLHSSDNVSDNVFIPEKSDAGSLGILKNDQPEVGNKESLNNTDLNEATTPNSVHNINTPENNTTAEDDSGIVRVVEDTNSHIAKFKNNDDIRVSMNASEIHLNDNITERNESDIIDNCIPENSVQVEDKNRIHVVEDTISHIVRLRNSSNSGILMNLAMINNKSRLSAVTNFETTTNNIKLPEDRTNDGNSNIQSIHNYRNGRILGGSVSMDISKTNNDPSPNIPPMNIEYNYNTLMDLTSSFRTGNHISYNTRNLGNTLDNNPYIQEFDLPDIGTVQLFNENNINHFQSNLDIDDGSYSNNYYWPINPRL